MNKAFKTALGLRKNLLPTGNVRLLSGNSNNLVVVEDRENIRLIGINRPEKRNCVNHETAMRLREEFEKFDQDDSSLVAVLHGVGGTFCAGYDLSELSSFSNLENAEEFAQSLPRGPMVRDRNLFF